MKPKNLFEYYKSQGKPVPSVSARAPLFEQYGLGKASEYTGLEQQNIDLLGKLQAPITSSQGLGAEALVGRIGGAVGSDDVQSPPPPPPTVTDSSSARLEKKLKDLEAARPPAPAAPVSSPEDTARLKTAQTERDTITTRSEEILQEKLKLQEEFKLFKQTSGEGVSETGRAGMESEQGRKIQNRLDSLNTEELVLQTKLRNRNSVISEIMQTNRQSYTDAVSAYNTSFSQALQLYTALDSEDDEMKSNAKASLKVLSDMYNVQIKAGTLNPGNITGMQRAKMEEYETQSGMPIGSTLTVLSTLKPDETEIYKSFDEKTGNLYVTTKDASGKQSTKIITGAGAVGGDATLPLSVLNIGRYNELYPDAGITVGDTEAQANAKVQASNTPEATTRRLVVAAQAAGHSYETVVAEINEDATIKDKATAIAIAKEVYGVTATSPIETEIAQMKKGGILTNADIRSVLVKRYGQEAVNNSSVGSVIDKIGSFLFGK